ncbi:pyridoxal phosphate-dependent aminotransferase [Meiothermus hypogaeus]|uniref:Aminotransferase n=2 Tax=Meiothermus hypogaeus TaxID=884155 RepID=A0A511QYT7_9DEIN|nr:pyridoxal phosphate-dependent aminotransferase [Meiothermus hypogaeus]RIH80332.1 Aspartate aminotransferase [Meiothermus hypogaeus]GEM82554.1 aminotransferase [Meiothermus hypogaeus NBRC 106114]
MSTSSTRYRIADRVVHKDESIRTRMLGIAAGLEGVIAMGRGDPDLDTPRHIVEAGQRALAAGATHYTAPQGMPQLRAAICEKLERENHLNYTPDEIIVTAGAQEGIYVAMLALINPGDEVLVTSPGYTSYNQAIELAGGVVVPVNVYQKDNFALTAEAVKARITPKTRMLCLMNPSNPTGSVTPKAEVEKLAQLAKEHDLIVISDEIYERLVFDGHSITSVASLPGMKERTLTLNGFSKAYAMTGWRIGYLAAPKELAVPMNEIHHGISICAPAASQHAALAALQGSQDCVEEYRQIFAERRRYFRTVLDSLGFTYGEPQGAFYLYTNVSSTGLGAGEFCIRLLQEARVMIFPGTLFGDHNDYFVRISLLQPMAKLEEAADRMAKAVKTLRTED